MANLVDHVRTEHEAFACDHCARRFQNKENLEEHVEEHVVKCDVCEGRFLFSCAPSKTTGLQLQLEKGTRRH